MCLTVATAVERNRNCGNLLVGLNIEATTHNNLTRPDVQEQFTAFQHLQVGILCRFRDQIIILADRPSLLLATLS